MPGYHVGVDIGGTFTDIVLLTSNGELRRCKLLSTPHDYAIAIVQGLGDLLTADEIAAGALDWIIHGTTVATNAILEKKGAKTGLLTTQGFRDVLEIGRMRRPNTDLFWDKPEPLVERFLRCEVPERLNVRGEVLRPIDEAAAVDQILFLRDQGVEAVAVTLLHSYANPVHEQVLDRLIERHLPGAYRAISSEVLPEIREAERTSTTVINAYLMPTVDRYLTSLERQFADRNFGRRLLIMQSSGGVMSAKAARERPVQIVESGPAAGVLGAEYLADQLAEPNLIAFDMGGTTAKATLIENGQAALAAEYEVGAGINRGSLMARGGGYPIRAHSLEISEVGAGGGSIAWIDAGGRLLVGPRSAGANPGPACYGLGGVEPTVTDAYVVLGYVGRSELGRGTLRIDGESARRAIDERVARPLGLPLLEAAYGIYQIANATMLRAIKSVSTERGRDPRDFTLIAFGGAGPLHAAELARQLDIPTVIIPIVPGLYSALGMLFADIRQDAVLSLIADLAAVEPATVDATYARLEADLRARLRADDLETPNLTFQRWADLHYAGQSSELSLGVPVRHLTQADLDALRQEFGDLHERTYGYRSDREAIELVSLRLRATVPVEKPRYADIGGQLYAGSVAAPTTRPAYFGGKETVDAPVVERAMMGTDVYWGPLVIEDPDATTLVPPGMRVHRDAAGNLVIETAP